MFQKLKRIFEPRFAAPASTASGSEIFRMRSRKPKGTFPFVFSTLCLFSLLAFSNPAYAGQAEARATALDNNCTPKKIEIYQQSIGAAGQTIWRVTCNLPKSVSQSKDSVAPDALMISCDQSLCDVMNPVQSEKK